MAYPPVSDHDQTTPSTEYEAEMAADTTGETTNETGTAHPKAS
jgi:hypothetical protein